MDFSQITGYLYIAAGVKDNHVEMIRELDVGLVISMVAFQRPPKNIINDRTEVLWLQTFDFVLLPIPVRVLNRGVMAALPVIQNGRSVLVYCQAGRHRSVAMASCILIGMGYTADDAMELITQRRTRADPYASHIQRQIQKFEAFWSEQGGEPAK